MKDCVDDWTDIALINACIEGRSNLYEILIRRHQNKVFNVLYRFFGNYETSQDISQETFLTAYNKLAMFGGKSAFSTWLCQIALNKARDMRRSDGAEALNEDVADHDETLAGADTARPDYRAEQGQENDRIQGVLNRMPAHYREVLILKHLEEYSIEEIAAMLNESLENVKVRTFRARQMFKQLYGELS